MHLKPNKYWHMAQWGKNATFGKGPNFENPTRIRGRDMKLGTLSRPGTIAECECACKWPECGNSVCPRASRALNDFILTLFGPFSGGLTKWAITLYKKENPMRENSCCLQTRPLCWTLLNRHDFNEQSLSSDANEVPPQIIFPGEIASSETEEALV